MIILVLNCGSSSLKYQLLDMKNDEVYDLLAKGIVERIGMEVSVLKHKPAGKDDFVLEMPIPNHTVGMKAVIDALLDSEHGVLSTLNDIQAVGHRVVNGGEVFPESTLLTKEKIDKIHNLITKFKTDDVEFEKFYLDKHTFKYLDFISSKTKI